jgi:hypothetical protein
METITAGIMAITTSRIKDLVEVFVWRCGEGETKSLSIVVLFSSSYNPDYITLGNTDNVKKRNVRRAAVEAASALDTILYRILLKFIHHIIAGILLKKERLKTHRTSLSTFTATDTCRLHSTHCLLSSQIKK